MVKKCTVCGGNNRDDASFCSSCGSSFTTTAAAPTYTHMHRDTMTGPMGPTIKPVPSVRVVSPITQPVGAPIRVPPPGMCYYHSHLPAVYICNRCGRPICRDCAKMYGDLIICPQCYQMVAPLGYGLMPAAPPAYPPPPPAMPPPPPVGYGVPPPPMPMAAYPPARATYGFLLSLVAGIMILLNAAALLSPAFYAMWIGIFPWIPFFGPFPPWILVAIGVILGIIVLLGAVLMILGYGAIGAVVVFPAAVISLIFGGGFIVGFVLGIVGGIMGMLGR